MAKILTHKTVELGHAEVIEMLTYAGIEALGDDSTFGDWKVSWSPINGGGIKITLVEKDSRERKDCEE